MDGKTKRVKRQLSSEESANLKRVAQSRTRPIRRVQRAKMLLPYYPGENIINIQRLVGLSRKAIYEGVNEWGHILISD